MIEAHAWSPPGRRPAELPEPGRPDLRDEGVTPFFPAWVVPLQVEGTGRPVFVFPAADNEPMAIKLDARIAAHVGRDHPFWAFARDASHAAHVREQGVAALAREYIAQIQAIQGRGPYLFYGHCVGGYLAWETARQLLEMGETIAGILFYEVPLRADYASVLTGEPPVHSANLWRLSHYYRVAPLPIDLTYVMTESWHARGWWAPWQEVTRGVFTPVVLPDRTLGAEAFRARREELIAQQVRAWIDRAEAR